MKKDTDLFKRLLFLVASPLINVARKVKERFFRHRSRRRYRHSPYAMHSMMPFDRLMDDHGAYGEYLVSEALHGLYGKWLFNLYLPHRGEETEIDCIFIGKGGVFLFESKNFKGRIYGSEDQKDWFHTYKNEKGVRKTRFFNPMMQNGAHRKALMHILEGNVPVHAMVVFGRDAELFTDVATEKPKELLLIGDLRKTVKSFGTSALTKEQIGEIYRILLPYSINDRKKQAEHIKSVNAKRYHR